MFDLQGKTAIVTGGAGGIGRYLCEGLARAGATVVCADIGNSDDAIELVRRAGGSGTAIHCDISDPTAVAELAKAVAAQHGGCDILVHCAAYQPHAAFADVTLADFKKTMAVNVEALFLLGQALLPGMVAKGWGRVISLTSTTFYDATPHHSEYVTSKAAIIGMTRIMAKEYGAHGVTVNCVAPGLVRTSHSVAAVKLLLESGLPDFYELIRQQQCIPRTLDPSDIVGPVLFLASDLARAVTGQSLLADGGWQHV